mgnify:CR=1 FL=1
MVGVVVKPSVELCRCMQEKRVDRGERENVYGCLELLEARNGYCAGCSLAAACCCIGWDRLPAFAECQATAAASLASYFESQVDPIIPEELRESC